MSGFWRLWLNLWCVSVAVFGIVLCGGAFPETQGPVRLIFERVASGALPPFDHVTRFSLAVMGGVTIGWAITLYAAIQGALALGAQGAPIWRLTLLSGLAWYMIDSTLSVATGFALNAVPNTVFILGLIIPLLASGVLKRP